MPIPIICLDVCLCQFMTAFRGCFSKPQYQHFVTVLLGLILCQERRTLSGLLRQVKARGSLASLSRFLAEAPWSCAELVETWWAGFRQQMGPQVAAEHHRQQAVRPKRRGRPPKTVVTGYLLGDDSTIHKRQGRKMAGLGMHYSTTEGRPVRGHSLVQSLYVLLGRQCPLAPGLYRQQKVCQQEGVPFRSKIAMMNETLRAFEPVPGTRTHVLLDSWYAAKSIWQTARQCGFLITTGLKSNRSLRVADQTVAKGWRWQTLADYTAGLTVADYQVMAWPNQAGARLVYVHVVSARVRKLYRCQVVIVRESLEAPLKEARFWASSDLDADRPTLVGHIVARWDIEVLFGDTKELLGLDQYQVMSATAILRFWTLVLAAYLFLEQQRAALRQTRAHHVTIGEARCEVQRIHRRHLIDWMYKQFQTGLSPQDLYEQLAA